MNDVERDLDSLADQLPLTVLRGPDLPDVRRRARRRRGRRIVGAGLAIVAVSAAIIGIPYAVVQHGSPRTDLPGGPPSPPSRPTSASHQPTGLSARTYPPAASFPAWGLASGCPATAGLDSVSVTDAGGLRAAASTLGANPQTDYRRSDRAFWPVLDNRWFPETPGPASARGPRLTTGNTRIGLAAQSDVGSLLASRCGADVVKHSLALVSCPHVCQADSSLNSTSIWIRRGGTWLIWFEQ